MRRAALALVLLACAGCRATAWPDGAPVSKVLSRRFTVASDLDPDVLAAALPSIDRVDEDQAARWSAPAAERRSLLLFADEDAYKAWREGTHDDAARWGCGDGFALEGDISVRVRRRESDDLGLVFFRDLRREREVAAVVGAVAHQLAHARIEARGLASREADLRDAVVPRWLAEGTAELERLRAQEALDRGLDDPYQPGESAVERALASLRLGVLALVRGEVPSPFVEGPGDDDGLDQGLISVRILWREAVPWAGQPDLDLALRLVLDDARRRGDGRDGCHGTEEHVTDRARVLAAEALSALVLRHPSGAFRGPAVAPAERLVLRLVTPDPDGRTPGAATVEAARARLDADRLRTLDRAPLADLDVLRNDLDAVLRELRVPDKQRERWLTILSLPRLLR